MTVARASRAGLDGKLDTSTPEVAADQVRSAVRALFTAPAVLSKAAQA